MNKEEKMNRIKLLLLFLTIVVYCSCNNSTDKTKTVTSKQIQLSEATQQKLITEINSIAELDQKYRSIISLGSMNPELIKKDKELRKTATLEEYMAFAQTVEKDLSKVQKDSLWKLQHELDFQNYEDFKELIHKYGYPSKERLGTDEDKLFQVLLHPPIEITPRVFLEEMQNLLLPEVKESRMAAESFALFVDNIKAKILKEPQLYGTNKSFNPATMSMGLPEIKNIEETNQARQDIGLKILKEGEYKLKEE